MSVFVAWCMGCGVGAVVPAVLATVWLHKKDRLDKVLAAIKGE